MNIEIRHKGNIPQRKLNTDVINMSIDVNKSASSILAPLHIVGTWHNMWGWYKSIVVSFPFVWLHFEGSIQACSQDFQKGVAWVSDVYVCMHKHARQGGRGVWGHALPGKF